MRYTALRIVVFYSLAAVLWIFFSDRLLGHLFAASPHLALLQTLKGMAFIAVSAVLLFLLLIRELTGRHQAQEALRESEARYRHVFENAPIGIYRTTPDGRIIAANPALAEMLGCASVAEVLARNVEVEAEATYPRREFKEALERDGEVRGRESVWHRRDGRPILVRENARLIRGEDGSPRYYEGTVEDVTETRAAQEALQASEERFRLMTEHTTDIVTILEANGTIRYESASIRRILGYEPKELVGQNVASLVHPDDLPLVLNEIAARLAEPGCISETLQVRFRHKDGSWRWIEAVGTNLLYHPAIRGLLVNSRDITERRRAEEERRLLASVVESSRDAIIVTTLEGKVAAWNRAAERVYGLKAEEVIGCPLAQFLPPEQAQEVERVHERIRRGETPEPFETVRTRPDGTRVHVSVTVSPTYDAAGAISGVSAIVSDITEKLRLQTLLIQQEKLAALGELVAGVAHEINNPLSAISGTAQLLQMHPDPMIQADANTIRQMCDRTTQIVRSLLTFARHPGSGARETTCLNALIEPPLEMLRYKLRNADIEPQITLAPDNALPPVHIDANQIQQIIVNLLNNSEHALRAHQRGEKRLEITTAAEERGGKTWALLTVKDNGCGIPEEARSRLFDPFFTTKPQGEGTGLGLSISYGIAQAHGGSLCFETEVGKGTAFTLRLPAAGDAAAG